eukprot:6833470-Prymnesium_polylepis.1
MSREKDPLYRRLGPEYDGGMGLAASEKPLDDIDFTKGASAKSADGQPTASSSAGGASAGASSAGASNAAEAAGGSGYSANYGGGGASGLATVCESKQGEPGSGESEVAVAADLSRVRMVAFVPPGEGGRQRSDSEPSNADHSARDSYSLAEGSRASRPADERRLSRHYTGLADLFPRSSRATIAGTDSQLSSSSEGPPVIMPKLMQGSPTRSMRETSQWEASGAAEASDGDSVSVRERALTAGTMRAVQQMLDWERRLKQVEEAAWAASAVCRKAQSADT